MKQKPWRIGILAALCLAVAAVVTLAVQQEALAQGRYCRFQVTNNTRYTLNIFVNGGRVGSVAPHGQRVFSVPSGSSSLKAVGPYGRVRTQQIHRYLRPNRTFVWTIHGR